MNELEHLRSMWAPNTKRKTELIVPNITYGRQENSLNNDSWIFRVNYSFRDALDIKYEERKKDKKPYMIWTQGPLLSFKEGDLVHSKDERRAVQVLFATKMAWDSEKGEMYQGIVAYSEFIVSANSFSKLNTNNSCTQMQFLQLLISGKHDG